MRKCEVLIILLLDKYYEIKQGRDREKHIYLMQIPNPCRFTTSTLIRKDLSTNPFLQCV